MPSHATGVVARNLRPTTSNSCVNIARSALLTVLPHPPPHSEYSLIPIPQVECQADGDDERIAKHKVVRVTCREHEPSELDV
jgi:hypothetical protein